jgi:hypothetical protein
MAGAASAAPDLKSDPPLHNLLRPKNGLDKGVHFRLRDSVLEFREPMEPVRTEDWDALCDSAGHPHLGLVGFSMPVRQIESADSGSLALRDFRLPFVFSEAKVRDAQLRGALDKLQARNSQEFGCLAAGDQASPVQLEHNHLTRRLLDRLAQSGQETNKVFAEI